MQRFVPQFYHSGKIIVESNLERKLEMNVSIFGLGYVGCVTAVYYEPQAGERSPNKTHRRVLTSVHRGLIRHLLTAGWAAILLSLPTFGATFRWASTSN